MVKEFVVVYKFGLLCVSARERERERLTSTAERKTDLIKTERERERYIRRATKFVYDYDQNTTHIYEYEHINKYVQYKETVCIRNRYNLDHRVPAIPTATTTTACCSVHIQLSWSVDIFNRWLTLSLSLPLYYINSPDTHNHYVY
jgi:hypothetical protein